MEEESEAAGFIVHIVMTIMIIILLLLFREPLVYFVTWLFDLMKETVQ